MPDADSNRNVLILSLSRKVPLVREVRRALQRIDPGGRVWGADGDATVVGSYFVDGFWANPPLDRLGLEDFVEWCRNHGIRWVIPTRDGELGCCASWREELEGKGIGVMVAGPAAVQRCVDKLLFWESLAGRKQLRPILTLPAPAGEDRLRWVVKERFGAGSRKVILGVSRDQAEAAARSFHAPVFQPLIEGRELSADVYLTRRGTPLDCVLRSRDLVVAGESQVTTVVHAPELAEALFEVAGSLELTGHAVFQLIVDRAGEAHLLECNCRFGGASTLAVSAGLESFFWFFSESLGANLDSQPRVFGQAGLRQVRYPEDRLLKVSL